MFCYHYPIEESHNLSMAILMYYTIKFTQCLFKQKSFNLIENTNISCTCLHTLSISYRLTTGKTEKSTFLTCHHHEIYWKKRLVSKKKKKKKKKKNQLYLKNYDFSEYVKFGAIWLKIDIL